ncbi:hypothetical protein GBAR_LOCUS25484 [Geodia barretti]|uniref:Uncharacterized protein n=1 Tax=Geodia barretti TaxID=519541 RepID=A0AA35XC84_GEOBA|nr:hypothetical protein GBAR_LOCUS25484 [Geodia barretti]
MEQQEVQMDQVQVMEQRVGLAEVVREVLLLKEKVEELMRCGITSFPMGEIGMVYARPEDSRLFGLTVKDSTTSDFTLYLYKCTVRDCRCENVEIKRSYETMYEEYLKTETEVIHDELEHTPDVNAVVTVDEETESETKTSVEDCDTLPLNSDNRSSSFSECDNEEASNNAETREDEEDKKCDFKRSRKKDEKEDETEVVEMEEEKGTECDKQGHGRETVDYNEVESEETGKESEEATGEDEGLENEKETGDGENPSVDGVDEDPDDYSEVTDLDLDNEEEDTDFFNEETDYYYDKSDYDETDEEVTDDEGSGVESEGGMFRSPRPTRSGFTYLSPQPLTPLTPSSPPQPPLEDLDTPFYLPRQTPRKRLSPYILNLIKQIEASLIEQDHDDPDKIPGNEEETEEQSIF